MKKTVAIIGCVALLSACGASKESTSAFRCGSYDSFVTNYENTADTTRSHIDYCLYNGEDAVKKTADSIVRDYLLGLVENPDSLNGLPVDELFISAVGSYFNSDYVHSIANGGGTMPPWYLDVSISNKQVTKSVLATSISHSMYTGGAHPNGFTGFYNLDAKSGKLLKLEDFCTDVAELTRRAEQHFIRQQELEQPVDYEAQGFWFQDNRFHLNTNFYVENGQLAFWFNQYEIAPYAMGVIVVEIPLAEISDLLKVDM